MWPRCPTWIFYLSWLLTAIHGFTFLPVWYGLIKWQSKKGRGMKEFERLKHLTTKIQEKISNMWCVVRFGIRHYLAFTWSSERMRMHANAFFYHHVVFICLHELARHSNRSVKCKHSQSDDVWMLLPNFTVSWELQCNVILHRITSCILEHLCGAVQCFH